MHNSLIYHTRPLSTLLEFNSERKVTLIKTLSYHLGLLFSANMIQTSSTHRLSLDHFKGFSLSETIVDSHDFQMIRQLNA